MKRMLRLFLGILFTLNAGLCSAAADAFEYEAVVVPGQEESISGKMLVIVAYTVIFGVLCLYTRSLSLREEKVRKAVRALKRTLASPPSDNEKK